MLNLIKEAEKNEWNTCVKGENKSEKESRKRRKNSLRQSFKYSKSTGSKECSVVETYVKELAMVPNLKKEICRKSLKENEERDATLNSPKRRVERYEP